MSQTTVVHHQGADRIDKLVSVVEKLVAKCIDVEDKLRNKGDHSMMLQLDTRIRQLENQFQRQEKDLEARLAAADASITDKMRQFKESRERQILPVMDKDNAISDEEMIKFMVKEEMNKMNEEERDLESRRRNIVIYRVPEKKTDVMAERKSNDTTFVQDSLDGVFNIDIEESDIEKMYRLGRWRENSARPCW